LVAGSWLLLFPEYQTNDDVAMRLLASGRFVPDTGPTAYLLFMNVVLGWALASGYRAFSSVPWYDACLLALTCVAGWSLLRGVARRAGDAAAVCFSLPILLVILIPFHSRPQFSMTAMLAATAGMALLAEDVVWGDRLRSDRIATLLALGLLVRLEAAALAIGIGLLLLFPRWIVAIRRRDVAVVRAALRLTVSIALIGLGAVAVNLFAYRSSPGWENFLRTNLNRGMLNEYLGAGGISRPTLQRLERDAGLSPNDVEMLSYYFFADRRVYTDHRMATAAAIVQDERRVALDDLLPALQRYASASLIVWVLLTLITVCRYSNALLFEAIWFQFVAVVVFLGLTAFAKEPPYRVVWPILALVAVMHLIAALRLGTPHRGSLAAVLLLASLFPLWKFGSDECRSAERARDRAGVIAFEARQLAALRPRLVIIQGAAFPYEGYWRPFHEPPPLALLGLGASTATPLVEGYLREAGLYPPLVALCAAPNLLLVANPAFLPAAQRFLSEHDAIEARFEPAFNGRGIRAYRCVRREDSPH